VNVARPKRPRQPIKITSSEESKIDLIKTFWNKYAPGTPFEYTFLDKDFEAKHVREKRLGQLSLLFTRKKK
jgi:putative ABC transport system permease protein